LRCQTLRPVVHKSREEDTELLKYMLVASPAAISLGCPARSLSPLFTDKELASLPAIAGTWTSEQGSVILTVSTAELQQLVLRFEDDQGALPLSSGLVRIK
jgi:hypothetical protein